MVAHRPARHQWQIAAFPVGGYVKFLGDASAASGRDEAALSAMDAETRRRTVHGAPLWARAATVAAGPAFNFILSALLFTGLVLVQGIDKSPLTVSDLNPVPVSADGQGLRSGDVILAVNDMPVPGRDGDWTAFYKSLPDDITLHYTVRRDGTETTVDAPHIFPPLVGGFGQDSAAEEIGIQLGDVILSVDGQPISTFDQLRDKAGASDGKPMQLKVWRNGETLDFTLVPRRQVGNFETFETRWLIGITGDILFQPQKERPGLLTAVGMGATQTWRVADMSVSALAHIARGALSTCNLRGPLGIAQTSGKAASYGLTSFIAFIAALSTAVGLLNLFPVPILDGGHLVFHAWEALTGRAPGDRALRVLMSIGLILLVALMVFALSNDVRALFNTLNC